MRRSTRRGATGRATARRWGAGAALALAAGALVPLAAPASTSTPATATCTFEVPLVFAEHGDRLHYTTAGVGSLTCVGRFKETVPMRSGSLQLDGSVPAGCSGRGEGELRAVLPRFFEFFQRRHWPLTGRHTVDAGGAWRLLGRLAFDGADHGMVAAGSLEGLSGCPSGDGRAVLSGRMVIGPLDDGFTGRVPEPAPPADEGDLGAADLAEACAREQIGTRRRDVLTGHAGGDLIDARGGNDRVRGLAGDDCLLGGSGHDTIAGGEGADVIDGGTGRDRIWGGPGPDAIRTVDGRRDVVYCGGGFDRVVGDRFDAGSRCERFRRRR